MPRAPRPANGAVGAPRVRCCSARGPAAAARAADQPRRALLAGALLLSAASPPFPARAAPSPPPAAAPGAPAEAKRPGLATAELARILGRDLAEGRYFVNARGLTTDVWSEDAVFVDPTNTTRGLRRYLAAVDLLFDPDASSVTLLSVSQAGPRQLRATWTLQGVLKLPWRPVIPAFRGASTYTVGESGLIERQDEEWSVSPLQALAQTFTPGPR